MARNGRSLQDLAAEIERRAEAKKDFIAPVTKFDIAVRDDKPVIEVLNGDTKQFEMNDIAHGQLAEYAGIPLPYYKRMLAADPGLLATNANRWLKDKGQDRRLIRTLDGKARALLSDKYRPLENEDLAEAVLPVLLDMDLMNISCEITERRLYIKAVDQSIQRDIPTGKHMGDGGHTIFDTICPALTVSNSEVGFGMLSVESGTLTRACTNLAFFGANMKKRHVGGRAEISEEVYALLTDDTKKATDRAVWMQVRDMVRGAFDEARFDAVALRLGKAAGDRVDPEKVVDVVERVGKRFSFNEGERKGILGALIAGGDLSRYGVHSAVTRFSQEEVVDYDRATEMERIGGEIIDLSPSEWRVISDSKQEIRPLAMAA
jgi:hypothetical protein